MTTRHPDVGKPDSARPIRWVHEVRVGSEVTFRRGKCGNRLVADWPGVARLTCAPDGTEAVLTHASGVAEDPVETIGSAPVQALLRDLAGHLALHASAVVLDGRAVLFLGESGVGKSTAAAEMCLHHGAHLLADDTALLEMAGDRVDVLPSEGQHSLSEQSRVALGIAEPGSIDSDTKLRLPSPRIARAGVPLSAVFALRFSAGDLARAVRSLRGAEAATLLLSSVIRFDVEDAQARRRDLEQLAAVYGRVPFFELGRRKEEPGMLAGLVLEALSQLP
jgi:hypothetical protein